MMLRNLSLVLAIVAPVAAHAASDSYTLFIVTKGADVKLTQNIPTLAMCEDAENFARTGMTVSEKKADDARIAAAQKEADDKWKAAHPPREPKTEWERNQVKARLKCLAEKTFCGWFSSTGPYTLATDDGKIQDYPGSGGWTSSSFPGMDANEIKYSKCLIEPTHP